MAWKTFFKKIQGLPESQKKIIFWFLFIFLTIPAFLFWLSGAKRTLEDLKPEEMGQGIAPFPDISENPEEENVLKEIKEEWDKASEAIEILEKAEEENISPEETEMLEFLGGENNSNNNNNN